MSCNECRVVLYIYIWMSEARRSASGRSNFPSRLLSFVKVCCTARLYFSNFVTEYSPEISISYWPKIASVASFNLLCGWPFLVAAVNSDCECCGPWTQPQASGLCFSSSTALFLIKALLRFLIAIIETPLIFLFLSFLLSRSLFLFFLESRSAQSDLHEFFFKDVCYFNITFASMPETPGSLYGRFVADMILLFFYCKQH